MTLPEPTLHNVFWFGVAIFAAALLIRFFSAMRAVERERRKQAKLCAASQCEYFTEYLQKGPATLDHRQYHYAADSLAHWRRSEQAYHEIGGVSPFHVSRQVELYRYQVRK